MKALFVGGVFLAAAALVGPVQAAELDISACTFPQAPSVPDGSTASEQEMLDASAAVKAFVAESTKGRECLDAAKQALGEEITEEQLTTYTSTYNTAVDAEVQAGDAWNQAVRAYKAKNPG
jgi:hypothetical protein